MSICKNPDCKKKIAKGLAYCSEECLRQHQNQKSSNNPRPFENTILDNLKEHFDFYKENPNLGTENKQRLMERVLEYIIEWKTGTYKKWISGLSIRLGLTVRTVRENYIDPLIVEGIIKRIGSKLVFIGIPDKDV
jgi:hypothetical protein